MSKIAREQDKEEEAMWTERLRTESLLRITSRCGVCTRTVSGKEKYAQTWFHCFTCGLTKEKGRGVCASCAERCHVGHELVPCDRDSTGKGFNYCDCVTHGGCLAQRPKRGVSNLDLQYWRDSMTPEARDANRLVEYCIKGTFLQWPPASGQGAEAATAAGLREQLRVLGKEDARRRTRVTREAFRKAAETLHIKGHDGVCKGYNALVRALAKAGMPPNDTAARSLAAEGERFAVRNANAAGDGSALIADSRDEGLLLCHCHFEGEGVVDCHLSSMLALDDAGLDEALGALRRLSERFAEDVEASAAGRAGLSAAARLALRLVARLVLGHAADLVESRHCVLCGMVPEKLNVCSRCKVVKYWCVPPIALLHKEVIAAILHMLTLWLRSLSLCALCLLWVSPAPPLARRPTGRSTRTSAST